MQPSQLLTRSASPRAGAMLTSAQLRAARSLVDWSREDLAQHSGVAHNTIKEFERGKSDPKQSTLLKWKRVLEAAGVVCVDEDELNGAGVRWKKGWPKAKR
jgi:ribosome-binding protein aMBF1 (putative translation factor)